MSRGYCKTCNEWFDRIEMHYRYTHQQETRVRFACDGHVVVVRRDQTTKRFHCPRCWKSYREYGGLHCHSKGVDCRSVQVYGGSQRMGQDIRAPEVIDDEATHASANSTTASSVSVSLGYRLRSRGLQTTRTQRALVRMYSRDEYTVHQIGEYMNLTPSAIWAAIRNEAGDNLDEDRGYCDGIVGDVINVDAVDIRDLQSDREAQAEELEVEKVLQGDARTSCATHEDPDSDLEVIGLWPTSLVRPKKMGTRERQRQPRTSRPGPLTSPGPSQFTSVASMGARRSLPRASGKSSKMKQRGVEQTSIASPAEVRASQPSPVRAFLGELAYPLGRLGDAIIAFGITTNLELDVFSGMREEWVLLQAFLFEKHGVTPLEWIVLKSGLEARAAKQNTH